MAFTAYTHTEGRGRTLGGHFGSLLTTLTDWCESLGRVVNSLGPQYSASKMGQLQIR